MENTENIITMDNNENAENKDNKGKKKKDGRKRKIKHPIRLTVLAVFLIAFAALGINVLVGIAAENRRMKKMNEQLNLGVRYLTEMDYEAAVTHFDQALVIDSKNVAAYMGNVLAYDRMGEQQLVIEMLTEGYEATESDILWVMLEDAKDGESLNQLYGLADSEEKLTIKMNPFLTLKLFGSNFYQWDVSACAELLGFNYEEYNGQNVKLGTFEGMNVFFDATHTNVDFIMSNENYSYSYRLLSESELQLFRVECTGDAENVPDFSQVEWNMKMGTPYDEVISAIGLPQMEENVYYVSDSNLGRFGYMLYSKDNVKKLYLSLADGNLLGLDLSFQQDKLSGAVYSCNVPDNLRSKLINWVGKVIH